MANIKDDAEYYSIHYKEFLELVSDRNDLVHLVTVYNRPGSFTLIGSIEWTWFTPNTDLNKNFYLTAISWHRMGFFIASFPKEKLIAAKILATGIGMKIVESSPVIVKSSYENNQKSDLEFSYFPGSILSNGNINEDMLTIENESNSIVYNNNQQHNDEIRSCERELVEALRHGANLTPSQIKDYIFGTN